MTIWEALSNLYYKNKELAIMPQQTVFLVYDSDNKALWFHFHGLCCY